MEIKKGKIVGNYLSLINLNLIVEFGRTAIVEILYIFFFQYFYCQIIIKIKKRTTQNVPCCFNCFSIYRRL